MLKRDSVICKCPTNGFYHLRKPLPGQTNWNPFTYYSEITASFESGQYFFQSRNHLTVTEVRLSVLSD